jgi:hypothetical protein
VMMIANTPSLRASTRAGSVARSKRSRRRWSSKRVPPHQPASPTRDGLHGRAPPVPEAPGFGAGRGCRFACGRPAQHTSVPGRDLGHRAPRGTAVSTAPCAGCLRPGAPERVKRHSRTHENGATEAAPRSHFPPKRSAACGRSLCRRPEVLARRAVDVRRAIPAESEHRAGRSPLLLEEHRSDRTAWSAYGWDDGPSETSDEEILERLLALNGERASGAMARVAGPQPRHGTELAQKESCRD